MHRLHWSSQKAMDFLLVKKPTITMKQHFFDQLILYEDYLKRKLGFNLSRDWNSPAFSLEDKLLSNTYLNTLPKGRKSPRGSISEKVQEKKPAITWNKKLRNVIPQKAISGSATLSAINSEKAEVQTEIADNLTVLTEKKPLRSLLKSKSAHNIEDRAWAAASATTDEYRSVYQASQQNVAASSSEGFTRALHNKEESLPGMGNEKQLRRNNSLQKELGTGGRDWGEIPVPTMGSRPFKLKPPTPITKRAPGMATYEEPKSELGSIVFDLRKNTTAVKAKLRASHRSKAQRSF